MKRPSVRKTNEFPVDKRHWTRLAQIRAYIKRCASQSAQSPDDLQYENDVTFLLKVVDELKELATNERRTVS